MPQRRVRRRITATALGSEPRPGPDGSTRARARHTGRMPAEPDGVDRLLIEEAGSFGGRPTVVLDDETGALSLGLPDVVGTWCDSLLDRRTVLEHAAAAGVELR